MTEDRMSRIRECLEKGKQNGQAYLGWYEDMHSMLEEVNHLQSLQKRLTRVEKQEELLDLFVDAANSIVGHVLEHGYKGAGFHEKLLQLISALVKYKSEYA